MRALHKWIACLSAMAMLCCLSGAACASADPFYFLWPVASGSWDTSCPDYAYTAYGDYWQNWANKGNPYYNDLMSYNLGWYSTGDIADYLTNEDPGAAEIIAMHDGAYVGDVMIYPNVLRIDAVNYELQILHSPDGGDDVLLDGGWNDYGDGLEYTGCWPKNVDTAKWILIPDSVRAIYKLCRGFHQPVGIALPDNDSFMMYIDQPLAEHSPGVTFYVVDGSAAHRHCVAKGYPFRFRKPYEDFVRKDSPAGLRIFDIDAYMAELQNTTTAMTPAPATTTTITTAMTPAPTLSPAMTPAPTTAPAMTPATTTTTTLSPAMTPTTAPAMTPAPTLSPAVTPPPPLSATLTPPPALQQGATVTFGHYEQDNNTQNGKEPVEWMVLHVDQANGRALLLSQYVLDMQRYNQKWSKVSWKNCTVHSWLDQTFVPECFSQDEQQVILTTENRSFYTDRYVKTNDTAFFLSVDEVELFLTTRDARKAIPTRYAYAREVAVSDEFCFWWLRDSSSRKNDANRVDPDGDVEEYGGNTNAYGVGVRPAIWVDIGRFTSR